MSALSGSRLGRLREVVDRLARLRRGGPSQLDRSPRLFRMAGCGLGVLELLQHRERLVVLFQDHQRHGREELRPPALWRGRRHGPHGGERAGVVPQRGPRLPEASRARWYAGSILRALSRNDAWVAGCSAMQPFHVLLEAPGATAPARRRPAAARARRGARLSARGRTARPGRRARRPRHPPGPTSIRMACARTVSVSPSTRTLADDHFRRANQLAHLDHRRAAQRRLRRQAQLFVGAGPRTCA